MKKKKIDIVSLILGILLLSFGLVLINQLVSISSSSQRSVSKRVQNAIYHVEDDLHQTEDNLLKAFDQWDHTGAFHLNDLSIPSSVGVFVFNNDSLLYWNNNMLEPKVLRKRVKTNNDTIINLNIGDFFVLTSTYGNASLYLFSLLNTTYPFENKYFVNDFQPLLGKYKLSFGKDKSNDQIPVYSRAGKVLSYYSILPQSFGSKNISLLIVCLCFMLLCAFLLISRKIVLKRDNKPIQTKERRYGVLLPIILFAVVLALAYVAFSKLFLYCFNNGFLIPSALRLDSCFLLLFVCLFVLVLLSMFLKQLFDPWLKKRNELLVIIFQVVFWSAMLTLLYNRVYSRYENQTIQDLAMDLSDERDPDFEQSYERFLAVAQQDTTFFTTVLSDDVMDEVAEDYLRSFLFDSVMNQYEVSLTLCTPGLQLEIQPENVITDCKSYFYDKADKYHGVFISDGLCFLDYNTLDPSYLSMISILVDTIPDRMLYLEFSKPIAPQGFGLPKIFQNKQNKLPWDCSIACYQDSLLIYKYGSFVYPNYYHDYSHFTNEFSNGKKLKHYTYQADDSKIIAISFERRGWMAATAPFVVFFFIMIILYLLVYYIGGARRNRFAWNTLSNKFQMMVLIALSVTFFVVAPVSVIYMQGQYSQKAKDYHYERTRTLLLDITSEVDFSFLKRPGFKYELDKIIKHYSETFFTDINVYGLNGKLLATTSPELKEMHLQSSLMNAEAFHNMQGERSLYYIHDEALGNAVYQSAYMSIQDWSGKTLAYLNTPYFAGQSDSDILNYILTYVNIILLIIFIFLPIVLVLTHRITDPLVRLQEKMRQIDINKSNEKLEWNSKDEIGALISQYNQLVVELEKSAAELRRTTTESAWRGVARQVAHEIHNSLTPMSLSVQMLERDAEQHQENLDEHVKRTSNMLKEQIDALSDIASSFSQYAKLPVNNPQPLNLAELVGNLVNLYDNTENIEFLYDVDPKVDYTFNGDKTNLNSAIGNIIKNATQAIGTQPDGKIRVSLRSQDSRFVITVKDNGKGIKEEDKKMIFLPNFTTKSGGSGVGLSLAYNIVQSAGGQITFESQEGVGTEFVITLPVL